MACCAAGEIGELKEELANPKMEKKKEAVKKVIAAMTVGKDVSMLFTDVLNCIQTGNIELKKLVYLYLINYAKSQVGRASNSPAPRVPRAPHAPLLAHSPTAPAATVRLCRGSPSKRCWR